MKTTEITGNTGNTDVVTPESLLAYLIRIERKLDKLDIQSNLNKDYLTTQEACNFLGCQRTNLWKLVKEKKLTKLKMENGRNHYAAAELKKLIESPLQDAA
jgi:excisionase family DNA binding protein